MSILDHILARFPDEDLLAANGYDYAVIGIDEESMRLIYSVKKVVEILAMGIVNDDRERAIAEAREDFDYNISGAYLGEKTPIWCYDDF